MRKLIFLCTLFLSFIVSLQAQPPVQVTPQLLAPYTTQISEYYSAAGNPKLSLLLLNKDFNRPNLTVRLRMSIEGQGVRIKTKEDASFAIINLPAGLPIYVQPAQLAEYFDINKIELSGITQQEYIQTGKLPEGFYTYCFETVETTTGQTVSNKGCTFAWINLNEPPLLNLPAKGESVIPSETPATQNVVFNWTPRHTASPGAAYTTTYILTLVEVTDNSLAPEAAFVNGNVIHIDSTNNSTYIYNNTKPALIIGKKYAWQVRAKTKYANSNIEVANFKNNGNSEVFWFLYKNNCPPVTGISDSLNGISGYRAIIGWLGNPQHLGYKVVYREKNTPNAAWFNITTTGVQASLNDLKPATEYEYRVGTACEEGVFTFAGSRYFTTKDSTYTTVNVPNCGTDPNLTTPANNPSPYSGPLVPGDTIRAGDFKVVVTNTPPPMGSGTYSGGGYVPVSYLGNMKLAVVFTGITLSNVNGEKRLFSGQIQTTYDPSEGGIESIDDYIDYYTAGYGVGGVVTGQTQADTTVGFPIQWPGGITMKDPFPPAGYNTTTGQGGPVTIVITPATPPGGSPINYTVNSLPKTIRDTTGNIYQVNANGTVTPLGQAGGDTTLRKMNKDLIDDDRAIVKFVEYNVPKIKYAFDEWKQVYTNSTTFNKEYERIKTKTNGKYYVSAKAIAPAAADYLKATLTKTDMSLKYDSIKFISGKGIIYNHKLLDSTAGGVYNYEINIVGGPEKDAQEIYAVYPQTGAKNLNLGKVLVASYPVQNKKLVLVPVNGAPINRDSIANALNRTYGKICVNWDVTVDANFVNDSWDAPPKDGRLQVDGSGTWSELTAEMKDLNTAYKTNRAVNNTTVYLFVLNQAAVNINGATVYGDMPRGKQFGYLFTNAGTGGNLGKTATHEIGHGIFALKHTFEYSGFTQGLLQPANIMDYPSGESLTKLQWDYVHDPAIVLGIFQSDEGNLSYALENGIPKEWRNKNHTVSFLAPNKKIVCLPKEAVQAYFTFGIGEYSQIPLMPTGVLDGFEIMEGKDKVYYSARFGISSSGNSFFIGYAKANTNIKFTKYASKDSLEEKGVAHVHLPYQYGFTVYRLEGLPHDYVTKDDGQTDVINLKDAASATLSVGTDGWIPKNGFDYYHIGGYNVSSKSFNVMFASTMADMDTTKRNTQYLLVAKIMEYRMVYPEIYDRMTSIFNDWTPFKVNAMFAINTLLTLESAPRHFLTTGKADLVGGYFDWLMVKNNWLTRPQNELLVEFLNTFISLIDAQKVLYNDKIQKIAANNYCPIKDSIWTLTSTDILNVVSTISVDDLSRICPASRAALIARILDASNNLIVTDPYEQAIYKLMWTCKKGTERAQFLIDLSEIKNSSNKYVLGTLVTAVDDRTLFAGKNFNTMIMNFILNAYKDLMNSSLSFNLNNIKPITDVNIDNFSNLTEAQKNNYPYRMVSYNYVSVTKRLFKEVLKSLCQTCTLVFPPPTDTKSIVSFNETSNLLSFENKTVSGFVTINSTVAINYNPLDPVIITDKNNLLNIYDEKASGYYMPAIMLYFLEQKADAKSTVESIQTAVDIASLAIPGAQSTLFYKLLNYADKLSSVSSLIASGTENDYPQFSKYMQLTSGILGLANLSATVYDINKYKNLTSIASTTANTTANTTQLLNRSENVLGALAHEKAVDVLCNDINKLGVIGQTPSTSLSGIVNSPAGKDLELLIQTLEMEKYAANSVGQAGKANQLEIALQKLRTVASGVAQIKTVRVRTILERMTVQNLLKKTGTGNEAKFFAKVNSTNPSDQIAHITNNELVIDKIDNLNDLGTTAKLSESIDNAQYINTANQGVTDDLLFFDDAGTIKCITGVNCFTAQTLVHTKNGVKAIMNITTDDTVSSYNENTKSNTWKKVTNVFNKVTKQLQKLVVGKDTLYATPEHTFYTAKGWLQAAVLTVGMQLQTSNGFAKVRANNTLDTTTTVYNFTVENTHTYYVGNEQLLTHNDCEKLAVILNSLGDKGKDFVNDFKGSGSQALLDKFYNGQLKIKAWEIAAKHTDNIRLDPNFLSKLSAHLDEFPNLKADLDDIDVFKAYKEFANDKVLAYEILSNVDGNLAALVAQKVANSTSPSFWKYLVKGKKFEKDFLLPRFRNRLSAEYISLKNKAASFFNNIDLDQYDMYSQVQLKLPSPVTLPSGRVIDYFVADQVYIKWGKKADGVTDEIKDMVIVENKLSLGTNLTPPQNAGKSAGSLKVRSNPLTPESPVSGIELPKDLIINTNNKWLKAYDSENGDALTDIIKL